MRPTKKQHESLLSNFHHIFKLDATLINLMKKLRSSSCFALNRGELLLFRTETVQNFSSIQPQLQQFKKVLANCFGFNVPRPVIRKVSSDRYPLEIIVPSWKNHKLKIVFAVQSVGLKKILKVKFEILAPRGRITGTNSASSAGLRSRS